MSTYKSVFRSNKNEKNCIGEAYGFLMTNFKESSEILYLQLF